VVAAISASMPTMRASDEHVAMVRDAVMAAARDLSAAFGDTQSQTKSGTAETPAAGTLNTAIA
jgi:hypothetical protein